MDFKGQHILETKQFDKTALQELFVEADELQALYKKGEAADVLKGKVLATLFFEPSTRTRFSFETAMLRLGGRVISNADMMQTSSVKKLEELDDIGKVVSRFADVIAMRHPAAGAVEELAKNSKVPVINGGDGSHDHPTQGLLDIYTISRHFGRVDGLTIGLVGDLKYSRVLHSQCELLRHYGAKVLLVSPAELKLPDEIKADLDESNVEYMETENLEMVIGDMDVLSLNRLQMERFENPEDCEKYRGSFSVSADLLRKAKEDMIIINPLPRMEELPREIDNDPRAKYFDQIDNGVIVRMALFKKILLG